MDIIFKVWLDYIDDANKRKHSNTYGYKKLDLPVMPFIGMEVEDPAWTKPMEVKNVTLNMSSGSGIASVYLGAIESSSEAAFNETIDKHKECGWEIHVTNP